MERPRKRRKVEVTKKVQKVVEENEIESDDDDEATEALDVTRKRASLEDCEEGDGPTKKRTKMCHPQNKTRISYKKVSKKMPKKKLV